MYPILYIFSKGVSQYGGGFILLLKHALLNDAKIGHF